MEKEKRGRRELETAEETVQEKTEEKRKRQAGGKKTAKAGKKTNMAAKTPAGAEGQTAAEVPELPPTKVMNPPAEAETFSGENAEYPGEPDAQSAAETQELSAEAPVEADAAAAAEPRPAIVEEKTPEPPCVCIQTEFRKRTGIIREQLANIQNSFVTIGFQLHWIKEHNMFRNMNYKNIYEYAEKEYGIGRSSCSNLICIIENYAERDGKGEVIESISECYRNYSSSQLVAMIGMPDSMKKEVTPDMSVRAINRMRKGIPEKQETEKAMAVSAETENTEQAAGSAAIPAREDSAVSGDAAGQERERKPETAEEMTPAEEQPPVTEPVIEPVSEPVIEPVTESVIEPVTEPVIEAVSRTAGTDSPAAASGTDKAPAEIQEREEEKGEDALFTFDSYSTYSRTRGKISELVEQMFARGGAVTVKVSRRLDGSVTVSQTLSI